MLSVFSYLTNTDWDNIIDTRKQKNLLLPFKVLLLKSVYVSTLFWSKNFFFVCLRTETPLGTNGVFKPLGLGAKKVLMGLMSCECFVVDLS